VTIIGLCLLTSIPVAAILSSRLWDKTPVRETASPPIREASADCGPRALLFLCQAQHVSVTLEHLRRIAGTRAEDGGTSLEGLARAARDAGFTAEGVQMDERALASLASPAIAWVDGDHYIAVLGIRHRLFGGGNTALIHDPNQRREEVVPLDDLMRRSGGVLLTLSPAIP